MYNDTCTQKRTNSIANLQTKVTKIERIIPRSTSQAYARAHTLAEVAPDYTEELDWEQIQERLDIGIVVRSCKGAIGTGRSEGVKISSMHERRDARGIVR